MLGDHDKSSGAQTQRKRDQNTFKSEVFAAGHLEQLFRKQLGGQSKGTETLFGNQTPEYNQSSQNPQIQKCQSVINIVQKSAKEMVA